MDVAAQPVALRRVEPLSHPGGDIIRGDRCEAETLEGGTSQRNISVGRRLLCGRLSECASEQPPCAARRAERRTSVSEQY
jgi:hypothetical protein